jgi:hypothetical protein
LLYRKAKNLSMKKLLLLSILAFPNLLSSQNLVLNPGFEDSLQCPSGSGAFVNYVAVWTKPSYGSADYFYNGCAVSPTDEAPRTGNACAGIIVYDPANIREYMTGHLSSLLVAGTQYTVSFYVSLNNSSMKGMTEIGAYATATNINNPNANPIILTPQVQGTMPYTDTSGWQLVQGTFSATGGEQYLIIGSFVADSNITFTNVSNVGWGDIYYFVDDVCLVQGTVACDQTTGIANEKNLSAVSVFPNPSTQNTLLKFENPLKEEFTLSVFDSRGKLVQTKNGITSGEVEIERNGLADGLYFFTLQSADRMLTGKLIRE